jgi:mannose/cellobiose epimerase-like protein (N-acyl-D-glucosamine 2-epimerase family)
MNRRRFFTTSTVSAAALLGVAGCRIEKVKPVSHPAETLKIVGWGIEELREQYRYDLFDDFLPFSDTFVVDNEQGGFICGVDRDGSRITTDKQAMSEGQGMWVYSFLSGRFDQDGKYLDIARKSLTFLRKNNPIGDNLWPGRFTRNGRPKGKPDARGYGDLAVALGLQEFARTSGEEKWGALAKQTFLKIVRLYDRPDYYPAFGQEYLGPKAPLTPGARVLGVWMRIIDLATQMLADTSDPEIEEALHRSVQAVLDFHHNPDFGLTNELLNHDLSRPGNDYAQLVHTGNAIEALRTILFEAARIKDKQLFDTAAERFRRHVETAWDPVFGGVYRCLNNVERDEWDLTKALWVHEEALVGALFIVEHTGEQWAKDLFGKIYQYVRANFPLKKYGHPLWITQGNRRVTFEPHADRIDLFHHPRHLMLNLLCLDRMLKRGGKVSSLFG